jgi:hypothetical protein
MEGRRIPLTPGATLRFGSLGFVYTGPAESVAGQTFAPPPRPDILTGVAGRAAFVREARRHVGAKPNTRTF